MKNINIPENTDLNDLIESINTSEDAALLNESTLMFDQSIYALLPYPLNKIVEVIDNPQKRDIALITSLTVLGSILRNYTVQHRDNVEGCQLSTYILGNASSGKGFATKWRAVGKEYHNVQVEKYRQNLKDYKLSLMEFKRQERDDEPIKPKRNYIFLSPDITKASLVQELAENEGYGLLFAPEADTIIKASQGEHGGFSDLLRTSFHGEPHSTNRKSFEEGPIEINNVRFGILLTSTLDQCFRLIPNYENGLFSRFIYYLLSAENKYVCEAPEEQGEKLNKLTAFISEYFQNIASFDSELSETLKFSLSEEQKAKRDKLLSDIDKEFIDRNCVRLQSNIIRYSLIFTRLCMLLSYLRAFHLSGTISTEKIECNSIDFDITISIVSKLINHLQILDFFYKSKNPKQRGLVYFERSASIENKGEDKAASLKMSALNLYQKGFSYGQISSTLFNDHKHKGTVHRWVKKSKTHCNSFPFPETETEGSKTDWVDVSNILKEVKVSVFQNVQTSKPFEENINLFDLITFEDEEDEIENYRKINNLKEKSNRKKNLIAFTPSGIFKGWRSKNNLTQHSGFICIDVDEKGNEHIENFDLLKDEFKKILNVAFCAHSVSGKGYFLLIPIENVEKHEKYFFTLYEAFKKLGIEIDKACKDVCRLRILSFDKYYYIATKAVKYNQTVDAHFIPLEFEDIKDSMINTKFYELIQNIVKREIDITRNYEDWFIIACAIANTYGESGRTNFHTISQYYPNYDKSENESLYDRCLRSSKNREKKYGLRKVIEIAKNYELVSMN